MTKAKGTTPTVLDEPGYEAVDMATLVPDPDNARGHSERNLQVIADSLKRFGQVKPIVVRREDRVVVAGNGTLQAAQLLGWATLKVVWTDLPLAEARAYALVDNRSAELAEWDLPVLSAQLQSMQAAGEDVVTLGWADYELEPLLQADWTPPAVGQMPTPTRRGEGGEQGPGVNFTTEQWDVVQRALAKVREQLDGTEATDGRCLELICAEYLS